MNVAVSDCGCAPVSDCGCQDTKEQLRMIREELHRLERSTLKLHAQLVARAKASGVGLKMLKASDPQVQSPGARQSLRVNRALCCE